MVLLRSAKNGLGGDGDQQGLTHGTILASLGFILSSLGPNEVFSKEVTLPHLCGRKITLLCGEQVGKDCMMRDYLADFGTVSKRNYESELRQYRFKWEKGATK